MTDPAEVARRAWCFVRANERQLISWDGQERSPAPWLKRVGELATAAELISRLGSSWIDDAELEGVIARCWAALDHGETLRFAIGLAADTLPLVTIYPPFLRAGHRNPRLDGVLAEVARRPALPAEIGLLVELALRSAGVDPGWDRAALLATTWLGSARPPQEVKLAATAYAVTHTVFALRDAAPDELTRLSARLSALPDWIEHYLQIGDLDLVAELIVSQRAIGAPGHQAALQAIGDAQEADGMVPRFRGRTRAGDRVRDGYHTTLAALLAASVFVADGGSLASNPT